MGAPEEWRVACVEDSRTDGFTRLVVGICRVKRAAELVVANQVRAASEVRMAMEFVGGWGELAVEGSRDVQQSLADGRSFGRTDPLRTLRALV